MYFGCRGFCAQATDGDDYADCSLKIPRATLIEDENVTRFRSEIVPKKTGFGALDGAWLDLDPVQNYCLLQVKEAVAHGAQG